ncbi:MAG: HNH endonuclease signature motif containing protein [Anaeromyxobacter sp.]
MAARLAALDNSSLVAHVKSLAADERGIKVDSLLALAEVERRKFYLDLGYPSLWAFCREELHLPEGGAYRRIAAMRLLSRFPSLETPLREGRLSLTTLGMLREVLTEENLEALVGDAAFKSKAEVERLVVTIQPREAPKDGVRRLSSSSSTPAASQPRPVDPKGVTAPASALVEAAPVRPQEPAASTAPTFALSAPCPSPTRPELHPVNAEQWSMRVTLDEAAHADLETLRELLSHKIPDGNLADVLKEALRCAVEKHAKRKGAVELARGPAPAASAPQASAQSDTPAPAAVCELAPVPACPADPLPLFATAYRFDPRTVTADVRRAVWARDGGCCSYVSTDGRRCSSRWQLELDHIDPEAMGGPPTLPNLRLRCRGHNLWAAVQAFGREHMAAFVPSLSLSLPPANAPLECDDRPGR